MIVLTCKKFSGACHQVRVNGLEDICLQLLRRHDAGLECHHRRTQGGARRREFCLFQGQLFGRELASITFKDDLLLVSEGQSVVAFLRAPHTISSFGLDQIS